MQVNIYEIRRSLNKAWLKTRPVRSQFEAFKDNIVKVLNNINESESGGGDKGCVVRNGVMAQGSELRAESGENEQGERVRIRIRINPCYPW